MYMPAHFEEKRVEAMHALIAAHPFGVVTHGPSGLDANHVPFELDMTAGEHGTLRAHVARNNPVWKEVTAGQDVLVIFQGEEGYISPNFYLSKAETHKQVPTWNYAVVHAHGRITIRDDESYVRGVVARLTRKMEAGEAAPWKMGDAPREFIDQMLTMIVGIEIEVTRLVGKAKLSQNKETADRLGAERGLRERGTDAADALANAMAATMPDLSRS